MTLESKQRWAIVMSKGKENAYQALLIIISHLTLLDLYDKDN